MSIRQWDKYAELYNKGIAKEGDELHQYLPTVEVFVSESARILKRQGKLIVVIDHLRHALFLRAQKLVGKKDEKFLTSASYFKAGKRKKNLFGIKQFLSTTTDPLVST